MIEYTNSQIEEAINENIHDLKHREILKSRLIDNLTHEELATKYAYSVRQIKRIVYRGQAKLFEKL